jgi:MFS family permease
MATITHATPSRGASAPFRRLWYRSLDHYPERGRRIWYLAIIVVATIVLYYQLYVAGAVAPSILQHYDMTFRYYVYAVGVVAAAVGAFATILAGMSDRWGRANMVTYGLALVALLTLFGVPNAPTKLSFVILISAVGLIEGIVLVATPAMIRDFSPQLGRATAMGFWTLGPVIGSLVVAQVASHTLSHLHAWQDQFRIAGAAGAVVFVIALLGLRELSPGLRDQLMVSLKDRALVETKAKGIDIQAALRRPWRQMLHLDIIGPAFGSSVLLLVYYALVGFLVIYFATVFHYTEQRANALANWFWAFNAIALVGVGLLSDRLRVRKPFMAIGAVGAIITTVIFLTKATRPDTSYYTFVVILSVLAASLGVAYAPWFASFTETIERRNPALTATGLAVGGWIARIVVTLSALILPWVVTSVTPLVNYGTQVAVYAAKYAPELTTAAAIDPATLKALSANPTNAATLGKAVTELTTELHITPAAAVARLLALGTASRQADFQFLLAHGPQVTKAAKNAPTEWQTWWWVCVAGEVVFIPFIFLMVGRWSPARAKRDADEHERLIEDEMAKLATSPDPKATPTGSQQRADSLQT